jgi:hypothetical protein
VQSRGDAGAGEAVGEVEMNWAPGDLRRTGRSARRSSTSTAVQADAGGLFGDGGQLGGSRGGAEQGAEVGIEHSGDPDQRPHGRICPAAFDLLPVLVPDGGVTGRRLLRQPRREPFGADTGAYLAERGRGASSDHGAE